MSIILIHHRRNPCKMIIGWLKRKEIIQLLHFRIPNHLHPLKSTRVKIKKSFLLEIALKYSIQVNNQSNLLLVTQRESFPIQKLIRHINPPSIFVLGVDNFSGLCTEVSELVGVDNFYCKSTVDRLKIQTSNPESYRKLVHFLRNENAEFHIYQLKEDKPTCVVIRNLHPITQSDKIKKRVRNALVLRSSKLHKFSTDLSNNHFLFFSST